MLTIKKKSPVFLTLLASVLLMALTHALVNNVLALFITPMAEALGVARSQVALMTTFTSLASVLGAPLWGWLYSRMQTKKLLFVGLLIFIPTLSGLSSANSVTVVYALAFILGFVFSGIAVMPVTLLVLENTPELSRALMLSIALAGSGLGGMILNPVVNYTIQAQGYQQAFLLIALLQMFLLLPLVFFLPVKKRQVAVNPSPQTTSSGSKKLNAFTSLLRGPFWILFLGSSLTAFISLGVLLNFPGYLHQCGYSPAMISLMTALGSGALTAGKILLGLLYDRVGIYKATLLVCLAVLAGMASLVILPSTVGLIGYVIFFGFGSSIGTVTPSYLAANFFHERESEALGGLQVGQGIGAALGIPLAARLLECVVPFQMAWLVFMALTALMTFLLLGSIRAFQKFKAL